MVAVTPRAGGGLRAVVGDAWRTGGITSALVVVGLAVRTGLQLVLAGVLGPAAFGLFAVARGWGELLGKLADPGFRFSAYRFVPAQVADGRWGAYRGFVGTATRATLVLSAAVSVVAAGLAAVAGSDPLVVAGMALGPAYAVVYLGNALLSATHRYRLTVALFDVAVPVLLGVGALALWATDRLGPGGLIVALGVAVVVVGLTEGALLRPRGPGAADVTERSAWTATAKPMTVAQVAQSVLNLADVVVVGMVAGTTEAGIYALASRVASLARIGNAVFEQQAGPRISAAFARGDRVAVQRTVDDTIRRGVAATTVAAVGTAAVAWPMLRLAGPEYASEWLVVVPLLAGSFVNAATGPSGFVVSTSGRADRDYAVVLAVGAVVLVALGAGASVAAGALGMAVARGLSTVVWNLGLVRLAARDGIRCVPALGRTSTDREGIS